MNCRRIQELIPLFVEDDLDQRRGSLVSDHLKSCYACRHVLGEFKESQGWLKSYVPREVDAAYFEQIEKEVWASIFEAGRLRIWQRISGRFWSVRIPIAVGAVLVVITGIAVVLLHSGAKDGAPNGGAVAVDGAGKKPDVQSARPLGPTGQMDHQRAAPASKISYKTFHRAHPAGAAMARIIGSPNPITSGFEESGEVSSDSNQRDQLRIYIQTSDPNIRIIWLVPRSFVPKPFVPKAFVPKALVPKSDDGD